MPSTNPENQLHHREKKKSNLQNHITSREHDPEETYRVNRDREGNSLIYTPSLPSTCPMGQGTSVGWGQNSNFKASRVTKPHQEQSLPGNPTCSISL